MLNFDSDDGHVRQRMAERNISEADAEWVVAGGSTKFRAVAEGNTSGAESPTDILLSPKRMELTLSPFGYGVRRTPACVRINGR